MDIKVVYDPKKGHTELFDRIYGMAHHLELSERLVTVYIPKDYKMSEEKFSMETYQTFVGNTAYSRFVEYGRD
jgi:hypothetical protein